MSLIPEKLDDWTLEVLTELVSAGVSESDRHDFKSAFSSNRGQHESEGVENKKAKPEVLTKLCCAFANTRGGFVILGVSQKSGRFKLDGVEPDTEIYAHFLKRVRTEPDIRIEPPKRLDLDDGSAVYVFEIPDSVSKPHLPIRDEERVFWKRVGSECKQMSLEEVRPQMLDYEQKRQRLTLLLIDIFYKIEDLSDNNSFHFIKMRFHQYDFSIMDEILSDCYSLISDKAEFIQNLRQVRRLLGSVNNDRTVLEYMIKSGVGIQGIDMRVSDNMHNNSNSLHELRRVYNQIRSFLISEFGVENPYFKNEL